MTPGEGFLETEALRGSLSVWQEVNSWALGKSGRRNECEAIGELGTQQNVPRVVGGPGKRHGQAGASWLVTGVPGRCLLAPDGKTLRAGCSQPFQVFPPGIWEHMRDLSFSHSIHSLTQLFTCISVVSWLSYCTFDYNHIQLHLIQIAWFWLLGLLGYGGLLLSLCNTSIAPLQLFPFVSFWTSSYFQRYKMIQAYFIFFPLQP